MTATVPPHDAMHRFIQASSISGVQLVRLISAEAGNTYTARAIEFDCNGLTIFAGADSFTVTNLAEPADAAGQIPQDTDAIALNVEDRWVVFVRPPIIASFPARVVGSLGNGLYTVQKQDVTAEGTFQDVSGVDSLTARNLAELSLGSGAAIDTDAVVLVMAIADTATPPVLRYVFDHPAYAKYLD